MPTPPPRAPAPPAAGHGSGSGPPGAARTSWTIGELLRWTQARFDEIGIEQPRLDAERLLAHALCCNRMTLYTDHDRLVEETPRARFRELVRRRLSREPVAYIEGKRGFHALGLELGVDARVLVPRPETEHVVDWLLEDVQAPGHVIDVGTGSGAIALAVKHARVELEVTAIDISHDALAVARSNAEALGLQVSFAHGDLLADAARPSTGWSAVAANLPYIATDVLRALAPEVSVHEPRIALDGGPDGLQVIERLVAQVTVPGVLAPGGAVYLEIGFDQAQAVVALLAARGFTAQVRNDHAGLPRVVRGRAAGLAAENWRPTPGPT